MNVFVVIIVEGAAPRKGERSMKKPIILILCAALAALSACSGVPEAGTKGAEGDNAGGTGEAFATFTPEMLEDCDTPVYGGAEAPDETVFGGAEAPGGGSEPFRGTGETVFKAQYIRTDGYQDGRDYPAAAVISSRAELDAYYEANKDLYDLSHRETIAADSTAGFIDAMAKYDEDWFASHQLVIVLLEEGSGSIRHEVANVASGEKPEITIRRIIPELGTCDMAEWHILIELAADTFEPDEHIAVTLVK